MLFRIIAFGETPASGSRKMAGFHSVGGTGEGGGGGRTPCKDTGIRFGKFELRRLDDVRALFNAHNFARD